MPKTQAGKQKRIEILWADFIRAWQSASSVDDVAEKTGLAWATVNQKAHLARKRGVPLKRFRERHTDAEWEALAALAKELEPKNA